MWIGYVDDVVCGEGVWVFICIYCWCRVGFYILLLFVGFIGIVWGGVLIVICWDDLCDGKFVV